jgi:hypothetical protein
MRYSLNAAFFKTKKSSPRKYAGAIEGEFIKTLLQSIFVQITCLLL